jgi:excinuclease UvrABC nuclease subunit
VSEALGVSLQEREAWRVPSSSGVYVIYDENRPVYVGKATNLRERFIRHAKRSHNPQLAYAVCAAGLTFTFRRLFTDRELNETERQLIRELGPAFNRVRYRDNLGACGNRVTSDHPGRE